MRLYRQTVEDFGLFIGKELSADEMKALREHAQKLSARMRAVRIVSAANVSKRDLEQRLIQKGEDPGQAKAAVAWMSDLKLVDDRVVAEQDARKAVDALLRRGHSYGQIREALRRLQMNEDDFLED